MNAAEPTDEPRSIADPLPPVLDSSSSKLVYLYLRIADEATIDEMEGVLGLKKVTLYPLLQTLTAADLVERSGATYVRRERAEERRE